VIGQLNAKSCRRIVSKVVGRFLYGTSSTDPRFCGSERRREKMARYSKSASGDVKGAMERRKAGTLKSGKSGKTVKSKKQAIAIGLSEARAKGKKVPSKKSA
jgi:hypothetical protein